VLQRNVSASDDVCSGCSDGSAGVDFVIDVGVVVACRVLIACRWGVVTGSLVEGGQLRLWQAVALSFPHV